MSNTKGAKGQCLSSRLAEPISNTLPSSEDDPTPQPSPPYLSSTSDRNTSIDSDFELSICVSTRPGDKLNICASTRPDYKLSISIHTQPNEELATHIEEEEMTDIEDEAAIDADDEMQSQPAYVEIEVLGPVKRASSCTDISKERVNEWLQGLP